MPARSYLTSSIVLAIASLGLLAQACGNLTAPPPPEAIQDEPVASAATVRPTASASATAAPAPTPAEPPTNEKITIVEVAPGHGTDVAKDGDKVSVLYKGTLPDGTVFDESAAHGNTPLDFSIGGGVIKGFSEGVRGMKLGQKRKVTIPPSLGYGARPTGKIPANSTLTFEIELVKLNGKSK